MKEHSSEFQVFVKPVGPVCNLNCSYCYYLEKKELYPASTRFIMSDEVLEKYIIQHFEASDGDVIIFTWHGGEPLLAGIDFYRKAIALQNKHKPEGVHFMNGIQTNGVLLDEEWCRFLAAERFYIGLSIDGPDYLHDINRKTINGGGTHKQVVNGYKLLRKHGIIPEILCVVNAHNVSYPLEVYNFFKVLGAKNMTFLPLVKMDIDSPTGVTTDSVPSERFGVFLSTIFDEWTAKDIGEIKVQIFEEATRTAFNQEHTLCIFKEKCGGVPVIEHNGDFFSCDHYVDDAHLIGNITDKSLSFFLNSERQKSFGDS